MFDINSRGSGGSSSSSQYRRSVDHASGQNAANKVGGDLESAMGEYDALLLKDPLAAVSSANRIRRLMSYLQAFKTGGNLAFHDVVPRSRLSEESSSISNNSQADNSTSISPRYRKE